MAKFLILRFSSIGDIVLTTPVMRCLKQQMPEAEVHYCTKSAFRNLVENNPYIDKTYFLDGSLQGLIKQLRAEKYDYIIDLHRNVRTAIIKLQLLLSQPKIRTFSFDKLNRQKWLLTRWKVNTLPPLHVVDRYMATLSSFGVLNDERGLDFFIPYRDEIEIDWLPVTHRSGYVAYAIGGQHYTKRLPLPRMIELCLRIDYPLVLLGGAEDAAAGDAIAQALGTRLIYNACGKYNLNQSASLLQHARVVFSHDTGLMHIAAALKKKVYSIWGNTTPLFGMYPYKTPYVVLENNAIACRPCSKIGYDRCPLGHFKCMNDLSFDFEVKELRRKNA